MHLRIDTLPLPLTQVTLPSLRVTLPPLKSSKEVKKDMSPILFIKHPLSKYYLLRTLALRVVKTILHLGLSFLNQTCFPLRGELGEFLLVLGLGLVLFSFLVAKFYLLKNQIHPLTYLIEGSYLSRSLL